MRRPAYLAIIMLMVIVLSTPSLQAWAQEGAEPQTETIRESGYCSNPDSDPGGAVWEQDYDLGDVEVLSVELSLEWTDDEGGNSRPDSFQVRAEDAGGNDATESGSGGDLSVSLDREGLGSVWTLTVTLTDAGSTPVGPVGILVRTDPGNSWDLVFTYTYVPVEPEEPGGPGMPPEIKALYGNPIFWTHVVFMIASTAMFGLVGLLAGIKLIRGRAWEEDPSRWKRALATNRPFRAISVHVWLVFLVAAIPLGMYVSTKVYGLENAWTSFPAVWNPWFYDITNADNVALIVLVLWAIPLWINRQQLMASRPHAWFFGKFRWFREFAARAPRPALTDREMAIIYFLMGVFVFLVLVVQPHGS